MPEVAKHPIAARLRERAMLDEGQLQTLLTALKAMVTHDRWKAADCVEKAIYAFRRDELESFSYELEQHEAERLRKPSTEHNGNG